jgi:hypothetical protein
MGRGGGQESGGFGLAYRRGSHAQIFFLRPQLLNSIKRNQTNQRLGFKGVARSQADEIADLFSAARGGGGSKVLRIESGDRRRYFVRKIAKLNTKSPPGGRVKTMDPLVPNRRASDTSFFAKLAKHFFRPLPTCQVKKLSRNSGWGG